MDAIGSGDYQFTNELLLFASQIKGDELEERDFHTLSNICELNMGDEPEKFPWSAYGRGMAKAAGIRGLAKLSRWDDRNRVALSNTLLNYLTGLLEAEKIDPRDALCLNRLAKPVEYHYAGTKEFAEGLCAQVGPDAEIVTELITQFEDDNPILASDDTLEKLCELATEAMGTSHDLTRHLAAARNRYDHAREERNSARGSSGSGIDPKERREAARRDKANKRALARIASRTDPTDEVSLVKAIEEFNALGNMYDLKKDFFSALRGKVPFAARGQYVHNIASLKHLYFYWKFAELKDAKQEWGGSSVSLAGVYKSLAKPLTLAHAGNLVDGGRFSGSSLREISEFTGVPMAELVLEMIKIFSRPDSTLAGSVWLAFATYICREADEGQGQVALKRLLSSESARIADNVIDGPWKTGCYPADDFAEIAAGLIWRVLGSSHAVDRWRAAHCIRRFAKFGRWDIVDRVIASFGKRTAEAFQAQELKFYYLHARLWLLIAIARTALDHPEQVARYKNLLLPVILETAEPHVLMQHFASKALLVCVDRGTLVLDEDTLNTVRMADKSPHPRLRKKTRSGGGFYQGRPKSVSEPSFRFHLEYDFNKHDVDNLGCVFGKGCWEVDDLISSIVQKIDPSVTHMYEDGGRESRGRSSHEITTGFHSYGQQLGWHALFIAAGKLLKTHPVTDDWWYESDPWEEWFNRYGLTRKDGLWLSDGTDRKPNDASVMLLEPEESLGITGDQQKIMGLAGLDIEKGISDELIIHGGWYSSDGIEIRISSALVPPTEATQLARKLIAEKPMLTWIPVFDGSEADDEYLRGEKKEYLPWIVCPSGESRLDEHDPYGVSVANLRPRLALDYLQLSKLTRQDPFGRCWGNNRQKLLLHAEAWGSGENHREDGQYPGLRLLCKSSLIKKVLTEYDRELLMLFKLQRYEKGNYRGSGSFFNTISVLRINRDLKVEYFKGCVNYKNKSDW